MAKGIFGERLKRERELREVTLEEVSKATRISDRFLRALEDEDWNKLPGGVFGRGFVRTIARYLGLNEEALLGEYDNARGEQTPPSRPEERIPSPPRWIPVAVVLGLLALLALLIYAGIYGWKRYAAHRAATHSSSSSQPSASPDAQSPGAPAGAGSQATSADLDLSVAVSAAAHVRVSADGNLLFDGNLAAGETRHFHAPNQFEVTASDSSSVLLELNGQAMPPIGQPGASGTMVLSRKDLGPADSGNSQP